MNYDFAERRAPTESVLRTLDVAVVASRRGATLAAERIAALTRAALTARVAGRLAIGRKSNLAIALETLRGAGALRIVAAAVLKTGGAIGAARLATTTADGGHVLAIAAHGDASFPTGGASLARVELVSGALLMRGASALARDLTLFRAIHRREAAIAAALRRAGLRSALRPAATLATRRARRAPALVGDLTLPLPIAEAALLAIGSRRH